MIRVLITGVTGFVGGHLAEALAARGGCELHGLSRTGQWPADTWHRDELVQLHAADLGEREGLTRLLAEIRPEWIFHLAGYAHPGRSLHDADGAWAGNLDATRGLFESAVRWGGAPRILFVSSGLVYGEADTPDAAVNELAPLRPASPYAASKAAADLAAGQYARHPGLDVVIVRPFNHAGPRQAADYAVARFASQVAAIEHGRQPPVLETGDLDARRDITDVRDVVRAYVLLLEKGRPGEPYNCGSGAAVRIGAVLDRLLAEAMVRIEVRPRPSGRPPEKFAPVADCAKLTRETGWRPAIPLEQTLRDTLDWWRRNNGK